MKAHLAPLLLFGVFAIPVPPFSAEKGMPDEQMLATLEKRAAEAPEKEQCYLYAELVHETVRYGADRYAAGEVERTSISLRRAQRFTSRMRAMLSAKAKHLKGAQILLRRAAFRLRELLHESSYEDRTVVEETLATVEQTESEALKQVLKE